jgi:hypothetical protein
MALKLKIIYSAVLFLFILGSRSIATNVAFQSNYSLIPNPDYNLTADVLDFKQLTDGVVGKSWWYDAYRDKTVGWWNATLIDITIDLDSSKNVGEVLIHTTGGGKAGVEYPVYVLGLASNDGLNYSLENIFEAKGWVFSKQGFAEAKVIQMPFNAKCRYVKLLIRPYDKSFFSDEIEVTASDVECTQPLGPVLANNEAVDYYVRLKQLVANAEALRQRLVSTDLEIGNQLEKLEAFQLEISNFQNEPGATLRLSSLEALFCKIRAEFLQVKYNVPWYISSSDIRELVRYRDVAGPATAGACLNMYLWQGENALAAFKITNSSLQDMQFKLALSPLKNNDDYLPSEPFVVLRRAFYVYSHNTELFADPLVLQGTKLFAVKPGETVQIVIEFNSKGLDAGLYSSAVYVNSSGGTGKKGEVIPLAVEVSEQVFPEKIDFMTCTWDYITDRTAFTCDIYDVASADLNRHHANVSVIYSQYFVKPVPDANAGVKPVGISPRFKEELDLRKHADFFLLFFGFSGARGDISGKAKYFGDDFESGKWERNFAVYIADIASYMKQLGYDYSDYAIYAFDEYIGPNFIRVAKIIREVNPEIQIYANAVGGGIEDVRKAKGLIDIWCPPLGAIAKDKVLLEEIKSYGCDLWSYGSLSKTAYANGKLDLLAPIKAAALGIDGAGFWAYTDWRKGGGGQFNDYDIRGYGAVYDGRYAPKDCIYEPIVPSIRWELWREAVEDAVALRGHKDLLDEFMAKPPEEITSEYLMDLRKRADKEGLNE